MEVVKLAKIISRTDVAFTNKLSESEALDLASEIVQELSRNKVKAALDYVRTFFPQITEVEYDESGNWTYKDDNGNAPAFPLELDESVLNEASNALAYTPATFHLLEF